MNLLRLLSQPNFVVITWMLLLLWVAVCMIFNFRSDRQQFLYWDLLFAILLALTYLTTISFLAIKTDRESAWFLIPPIVYCAFDLIENSLELGFGVKSQVITGGKWISVTICNLIIIVLIALLTVSWIRNEG